MSQLVACPLDRVIVRAAKHRAHGLSMPEISQKLGHSEEAIIQILEENPRLWQLELNRARREILSEAVNQVVLKMGAMLLLDDTDKHFVASDRLIKVLFAQNKKRPRSASRPRPEFIYPTPALKLPTPTQPAAFPAPAEEISPRVFKQVLEFNNIPACEVLPLVLKKILNETIPNPPKNEIPISPGCRAGSLNHWQTGFFPGLDSAVEMVNGWQL